MPRSTPNAFSSPAPTKPILKAYVADVRRQAAEAGRDPRKVLTYNLVTVIVDETDAKAQAKFAEYQQYASYDGALVFMSGWSGIDFGQYAPTDLVKKVETNAIVSVVENLAGGSKSWTIEELAQWGGIGGLGPVFVGSPSTIADILQGWVEETDVDGFNLAYAVTPETFEDVVNLLVPELQKPWRLSEGLPCRHAAREAVRRRTAFAGKPSRSRLSRYRGGQAARGARSARPTARNRRGLTVDVRADPAASRRLPVVQRRSRRSTR